MYPSKNISEESSFTSRFQSFLCLNVKKLIVSSLLLNILINSAEVKVISLLKNLQLTQNFARWLIMNENRELYKEAKI